MENEIKLTFNKFITHIPQSKVKWVKIGYNKIHASPHFAMRAALVAAMHKYIEDNIPDGLTINTPIKTHLIIYAPINYGSVKRLKDKKTGKYKISWNPARKGYVPNWDLFNLAAIWLKSLDDVLVKKGIFPDDTIEFFTKTTFEYKEVSTLDERKLIYYLKTIK